MEPWKTELNDHFAQQKKVKKENKEQRKVLRQDAREFIKAIIEPAYEDLKDELKRYKRDCEIDTKKGWAALIVRRNKKKEFIYELTLESEGGHLCARRSSYLPNEKGKLKLGLEGKIHVGGKTDRMEKISRADIIADFLECYKQTARAR